MFKNLLQAAVITFLLHLMVNGSPKQSATVSQWEKLEALVFVRK